MPTSEDFFNETLRIDRVIYLPGAVIDSPSPDFVEFCEDLPERGPQGIIYSQLPILDQFADGDERPDEEHVAEVLSRTPGFLLQAASPVKTRVGKGVFSYSWGYYNTCWLYAPTEAEIFTVAKAWAETVNTGE